MKYRPCCCTNCGTAQNRNRDFCSILMFCFGLIIAYQWSLSSLERNTIDFFLDNLVRNFFYRNFLAWRIADIVLLWTLSQTQSCGLRQLSCQSLLIYPRVSTLLLYAICTKHFCNPWIVLCWPQITTNYTLTTQHNHTQRPLGRNTNMTIECELNFKRICVCETFDF